MTDATVSIPQPAGAAGMPSWARSMAALVRRERREHVGMLVWLPVAVAGSLATAALGATAWAWFQGGQWSGRAGPALLEHAGQMGEAGVVLALGALAPLMLAWSLVAVFYATGALFDERRDRSVLFFKSLPVSDAQTVASKALVACLLGPGIALALGSALALLLAALGAGGMGAAGAGGAGAGLAGGVLGTLGWAWMGLPVLALWALPTVGWWLLVSAVARSKPLLWALLVPPGLALATAIADVGASASWVGQHLVWRALVVWPKPEALGQAFEAGWMGLLASPSLWVGAGVGLGLLGAAARVRRWQDEG